MCRQQTLQTVNNRTCSKCWGRQSCHNPNIVKCEYHSSQSILHRLEDNWVSHLVIETSLQVEKRRVLQNYRWSGLVNFISDSFRLAEQVDQSSLQLNPCPKRGTCDRQVSYLAVSGEQTASLDCLPWFDKVSGGK